MFVCKYQTQSGRELRKPVEWLIAAIRATTIELQGSTPQGWTVQRVKACATA
jgi:hypothetical protein